MTTEAMDLASAKLVAFCNMNCIREIIGVQHGGLGSSIHIELADFLRVFAGCSVPVTTNGGYDQLSVTADGITVLALRPTPMTLPGRREVLP